MKRYRLTAPVPLRAAFLGSVICVMALAATAGAGKQPPDPALAAMLGSACPPSRTQLLAEVLRPVEGDTRSLAQHFRKDSASGQPRFVADDLTVDVALPYGSPFRVTSARLVLEPSADGSLLRFEVDGPIFGAASRVSASGKLEWGKGPLGGDRMTIDVAIDDADVEVLRIPFPDRFDPAFVGPLDLSVHGEGVVGEHSTEEAPASALKGKLDGSLDWVVLGRRDTLEFSSAFSVDDRSVRLSDGRLKSFGLAMNLFGWFDPAPGGRFRLNGEVADVDVAKVSADWNVPQPWRATATVGGKTEFWGVPGKSFLSYDFKAPDVSLPALGGYSVRTGPVRMTGRVLGINTDASLSVQPSALRIGTIELGQLPVGLNWWRGVLSVSAANSTLWGGSVDGTLRYVPDEGKAFACSGLLGDVRANEFASTVLQGWPIDVDGKADIAYRTGQDADGVSYFSARAGLKNVRLGGRNLIEQALAALASAPHPIAAGSSAVAVPEPKKGEGSAFDMLFLEVERRDGEYRLGGISGRAGDFELAADGTLGGGGKDAEIDVRGTLYLPPTAAEALLSKARWAAPLRAADGGMFVPLHIAGKPDDCRVSLTAEFLDAMAAAHDGKAVTPFGRAEVEHVATSGLARLSGDPNPPESQ